jgi:hypothetical protein
MSKSNADSGVNKSPRKVREKRTCVDLPAKPYKDFPLTRHPGGRWQKKIRGEVRGTNRRVWLPMVEVAPVGANLQRQATVVLEAFSDRRLSLYADADLRRDLNRMRVVEKAYGFRLESPHDSEGHGDMGSAFCLALLAASEIAAIPDIRLGGGEFGERSGGLSDLEQRQREYQEERAALGGPEDHNEELRLAMWQIGRTDSPFSQ